MSISISEFKEGFTWRSIVAILASTLIFVPVSVYLSMVTGAVVGMAATLLMVLVFSELASIFGNMLTTQETLVMYESLGVISSIGAASIGAYWVIFRIFYVTSPINWAFRIHGVPLPRLVPSWLGPPLTPTSEYVRTFFQSSMIAPLIVYTTFFVLGFITEIALTMLLAPLFLEVEKLPFPFANIDVGVVNTLATRDIRYVRVFISLLFPGLLYGIFAITLPLLGAITFIPLPWVDLTPYTDSIIPGAIIGIATDAFTWAVGLIVPFSAALSMFIGSTLIWIIGNNLFLTTFRDLAPLWAQEYRRGMGIPLIWQRSLYRVWFAPQIGFGLGLMFLVLLITSRNFVKFFKSLSAARRTGHSLYPNPILLFAVFLFATSFSAILHNQLTGFPLYISLVYSVVLSLLYALANTMTLGTTGYGINLPYLWHTIVYFSGYEGYSGWVIGPVLGGGFTPGMLNMLRAAYLTKTKPLDVIKGVALGLVMAFIVGTLSLELFWRIAPIPSSLYPFSLIDWARISIGDSLLITRQIRIDPQMLGGSAAFTIILAGLFEALRIFTHAPLSGPGLVAGFFTLPPYTIVTLIMSTIGNFLIPRVVGRETWDQLKGAAVGGLATGYGLAVGLTIALFFVRSAGWIWPW